jgi:hypothetical protein
MGRARDQNGRSSSDKLGDRTCRTEYGREEHVGHESLVRVWLGSFE